MTLHIQVQKTQHSPKWGREFSPVITDLEEAPLRPNFYFWRGTAPLDSAHSHRWPGLISSFMLTASSSHLVYAGSQQLKIMILW